MSNKFYLDTKKFYIINLEDGTISETTALDIVDSHAWQDFCAEFIDEDVELTDEQEFMDAVNMFFQYNSICAFESKDEAREFVEWEF